MSSRIHPAIITAQAVYDLPGDLNTDQQAFLTAVHLAGRYRTETVALAIQMYGRGSRAAEATRFLADRKQVVDLAAALDRYEQSLEDQDDVLAIELATAEAAE
jgi:hypothetical protein